MTDFTAFVTPQEVWNEGLGSRVDLSDIHVSETLERLVLAVSRQIESYLNRRLAVHPVVLRPSWTPSSASGRAEAWAEEWPLIQVDTAGVTAGEDNPGGQLIYSFAWPPEVTGFAGYRRVGATLEDLAETLPGLTVLPPVLPDDVRDVAIELVLHRLAYRESGLAGMRELSLDIGGRPVTTRAPERGYEASVLRRIAGYRRLA